ncbi:hypothetical protein [Arhodomonas sp. AD133]|uniref:hypothetical protein n=1 Tax=Arhodomonas sp. AD133 TaxID=3415009 RepID=UPI003EBC1D46
MSAQQGMIAYRDGRRLRLAIAETDSELQRARDLRDGIYANRVPELSFDPHLEAERDAIGRVFLLYEDDCLVATLRATPVARDPAPLSGVVSLDGHSGLLRDPAACEVSRLAVPPSPRRSEQALLLLSMGAQWVLENDPTLERFLSYCRSQLLRLYTRVGAEPVAEPFRIAGRGEQWFYVIGGRLADAAALAPPRRAETARQQAVGAESHA